MPETQQEPATEEIKTPAKTEWDIPEEFHGHIRHLNKEKSIAKLRMACNTAQFNKAIRDNNPELAYEHKMAEVDLDKAENAAHDAFWGAIHNAIPELDRENNYAFDFRTMKVSVESENPTSNMRNILSMLKG